MTSRPSTPRPKWWCTRPWPTGTYGPTRWRSSAQTSSTLAHSSSATPTYQGNVKKDRSWITSKVLMLSLHQLIYGVKIYVYIYFGSLTGWGGLGAVSKECPFLEGSSKYLREGTFTLRMFIPQREAQRQASPKASLLGR